MVNSVMIYLQLSGRKNILGCMLKVHLHSFSCSTIDVNWLCGRVTQVFNEYFPGLDLSLK